MMSEEKVGYVLKSYVLPIFIAVVSIFLLAQKIPKTTFVESTIDSIEESKNTVMEFSGATLATSVAISALPDDFATPLANTLAGMNKYFVFTLIIIFVEKLLVVEGIVIAFKYLIPISCVLYLMYSLIKKDILKRLAQKIFVFGLALILVVPCSTHFVNEVGEDYLKYVDQTIEEANTGADKINGVMEQSDENESFFDKVEGLFSSAIEGVSDLLAYFNNIVKRCVNSIAILIVTTFIMPIITFMFFKWLIKELFNVTVPQINTKQYEELKKILTRKNDSITKEGGQ